MGTSPVSNKKMMVTEEKHAFPEVSENDIIIWHMAPEMYCVHCSRVDNTYFCPFVETESYKDFFFIHILCTLGNIQYKDYN